MQRDDSRTDPKAQFTDRCNDTIHGLMKKDDSPTDGKGTVQGCKETESMTESNPVESITEVEQEEKENQENTVDVHIMVGVSNAELKRLQLDNNVNIPANVIFTAVQLANVIVTGCRHSNELPSPQCEIICILLVTTYTRNSPKWYRKYVEYVTVCETEFAFDLSEHENYTLIRQATQFVINGVEREYSKNRCPLNVGMEMPNDQDN
ncbi:hypothetical protein CHS0354_003294 [Potamilus streckersoni]|uniref:Uncharacterized protein n=1 Tax=Potamilus streckersoni TaxID=2493646 RepID=A0AAE0S6E8_9BIVA|nr:hypothetical protein CHS0354_003294 [Potamilus streckersoni]